MARLCCFPRTLPKCFCRDSPEKLKFTVEGEVRTGKAEAYLAIPVVCEVAFPRVGKRFYASGELLSVEQSGPPTEYEPEEEQMDFSYLSESDD